MFPLQPQQQPPFFGAVATAAELAMEGLYPASRMHRLKASALVVLDSIATLWLARSMRTSACRSTLATAWVMVAMQCLQVMSLTSNVIMDSFDRRV